MAANQPPAEDLRTVDRDLLEAMRVLEAEGFRVEYRYELEPVGERTRVTLIADISASGLKKLMTPVVKRIIEKMDGDHLERLAAAMSSCST